MATMAARLRETAARPPGLQALHDAAQRAAMATTNQFAAANLPIRAEVRVVGQGFRINLVQFAKLTRPVVGKTPAAVLHDNVTKEMRLARAQIAADARKALTG